MMYRELSNKKFIEIVSDQHNWKKNLGLFWTNEENAYVGMDNTTGDAWVEEFETLRGCLDWLVGDENNANKISS